MHCRPPFHHAPALPARPLTAPGARSTALMTRHRRPLCVAVDSLMFAVEDHLPPMWIGQSKSSFRQGVYRGETGCIACHLQIHLPPVGPEGHPVPDLVRSQLLETDRN